MLSKYSLVTLVISHIRLTCTLCPGDQQNHHRSKPWFSFSQGQRLHSSIKLLTYRIIPWVGMVLVAITSVLLNQWLWQTGCLQVHHEGERVATKVLTMVTKTFWENRIFHHSVDEMKAEFPCENIKKASQICICRLVCQNRLLDEVVLYCVFWV